MLYSNFAYADLNLDFDHQLFADEYDRCILPASRRISNGQVSWQGTRNLNKQWGMVPPDVYDLCSISVKGKLFNRGIHQWQMSQLMQLVIEDGDSEELKKKYQDGGTALRNQFLHRKWEIQPRFENLEIVKWIYQLPVTDIKSIHCVSLEPGEFASIHRDNRMTQESVKNNGVYQQGFVVLTLNISNGGVPLYWALDGKDLHNCKHVDSPVYVISDYFLHGVPVVTSRRRQIRVTARPTKHFEMLLKKDSCIILDDDYKFDESDWYPG